MNRLTAWLYASTSRLRALFTSRALDEDFDQEIHSHLSLLEEENIRQGMSKTEARYAALRSFGGVTQMREGNRERRSVYHIERLFQDLRYAARMMRRNPGFTAVAVLTLALGIGASTAIFSVVEGVVIAPLPYQDPERLVFVLLNNLSLKHVIYTSYPDFRDWQRDARSFEQMAALRFDSFDLTNPGTPEHLDGEEVSSGFFSTLGVKMALGREFSPDEDRQNGAPVVVISDHFWRQRFAAGNDAPGKTVTLNGLSYTVVGVAPAGFRFLNGADVYIPLGQGDPILKSRTTHALLSIARLKPGASLSQAQSEMNTIQENLNRVYSSTDRGLGVSVLPLKELMVGDLRATLFLLLGAVGIVLLIACANVANLLLARSASRRHEFAIRTALGANRARIGRQLITESVLLSIAGGSFGLAVARVGLKAVLAALPEGLPRSETIGVDLPVLLFTLGVSVVAGILFGLAPALKNWRAHGHDSLKQGNRTSVGGRQRAQNGIVILQMALTLVLLAGAGLMFRTIRHLWEVNPGFETQHLITFKVGLSPSATSTPAGMRVAYRQLTDRIRHIPGIQAVDLTTLVPLGGSDNSIPFWIGSRKPASMAEAPRVLMFSTGPNYLETMGIPLLQGRFYGPEDTTRSELVMVIDSAMAHAYFPKGDALGQTISFPTVGPYRIIGIAGHVRHYDLAESSVYSANEAYTPFYQIPDQWLPVMHVDTTVVLRTALDLATITPALKAAVYGADNDQPIYDVHTMKDIVSESTSSQRFPMVLLETFAAVALMLALVGIYGVISYLISQRVREIGIRMALGAEKTDILGMVIGQGLRLAVAGTAIGTAVALVLSRLLSSFSHLLYGVRGSDPLTLVSVSLVLMGGALMACYIPARRAAQVDPIVALHQE